MTIHATFNPIGSTSPKDLIDNAQNLDYLILGPVLLYPDRRGVNRLSWAGIEASFAAAQRDRSERFDAFIASSGYEVIGDYASQPVTFTERNQLMLKDGELWKPKASVALPYVTTGVWASESAGFVSVGDAALRQELASPTGSRLVAFLRNIFGAIKRSVESKLSDHASPMDMGAIGDGVTDDTAAFQAFEAAYAGQVINLYGRTHFLSYLPLANAYVNGYYKINGVLLDAHQSAVSLGSAIDTGGTEDPYSGGTNGTPTVSGRGTFYNRVLIACGSSRAMFVRSALVACIYTWVKGNVAFAAASRQCVVNGPQASTLSAEECQAYGFRAFHVGSVFGEAMGSTVGSSASRLARVAGSYSMLIGTNTCRVGAGRSARIRPVVVGGQVTSYMVEKGGAGFVLANTVVEVIDRSSFGSGATATITVDGAGTIISCVPATPGANYTNPDSVEVMLVQPEAQCVILSSLTSNISGANTANSSIMASTGSAILNSSNAAIIASDSGNVTAGRGVLIGTAGSSATGIGAVVIGATNCIAEAIRSVIFGRRGKTVNEGSVVIAESPTGVASSANNKIEMTSAGNIRLTGTVSPGHIFTDYGEMFPNYVFGELAPGTIVTRIGDRVKKAEAGDRILGVVSKTAAFISGDTPFHWAQRFLYDEFDQKIMTTMEVVAWPACHPYSGTLSHAKELGLDIPGSAVHTLRNETVDDVETGDSREVQVEWVEWEGYEGYEGSVADMRKAKLTPPQCATYSQIECQKENPNYDPTAPNIPRSERPNEWTCVGLMGQLRVKVGADVEQAMLESDGTDLIYVAGDGSLSATPTRLECMKIRTPFNAQSGYAVALCLALGS